MGNANVLRISHSENPPVFRIHPMVRKQHVEEDKHGPSSPWGRNGQTLPSLEEPPFSYRNISFVDNFMLPQMTFSWVQWGSGRISINSFPAVKLTVEMLHKISSLQFQVSSYAESWIRGHKQFLEVKKKQWKLLEHFILV